MSDYDDTPYFFLVQTVAKYNDLNANVIADFDFRLICRIAVALSE